ncbi:MAG: HD domain-containing protein, partial [Elusimicrobia bacterium]|nr:HD domain-containing protein [Elusimicrobiota bacterium]
GAEILSKIDNIDSIVDGIKYHHERYDGKGYPSGVKIGNLPMIASIISLADAYDAMTSDRPYRKALTPDQAHKEILENSGKQFHPVVVKAFIEFYRKYIFRGKN